MGKVGDQEEKERYKLMSVPQREMHLAGIDSQLANWQDAKENAERSLKNLLNCKPGEWVYTSTETSLTRDIEVAKKEISRNRRLRKLIRGIDQCMFKPEDVLRGMKAASGFARATRSLRLDVQSWSVDKLVQTRNKLEPDVLRIKHLILHEEIKYPHLSDLKPIQYVQEVSSSNKYRDLVLLIEQWGRYVPLYRAVGAELESRNFLKEWV